MSQQRSHRRRGMKTAAAGLTLAMAVAFAPGAVATAFDSTAFQQAAQAADGDAVNKGPIDIDAIASGKVTKSANLTDSLGVGKDIVSGRAQIVTPTPGAQLTSTWGGFQAVPANQNVYLQWIDSDGAVSPIYSAKTHELKGAGHGVYAFDVPSWTDNAGKEHKLLGKSSQKYRVWGEDFKHTDPETGTDNWVRQLRAAPGYTPFSFGRASGEGLGDFPGSAATATNTTKTGIWFYEEPGDYVVADQVVETPQEKFAKYAEIAPGTVSGRVWLETDRGNENQLFAGATKNTVDPHAEGYTVWASVLSDKGIQANNQIMELHPSLRAKKTQEMLKDKSNLAKTGKATVNKDGRYTVDLGEDYDKNNLYMWVTDPAGNVVSSYSTYTQPVFTNPRYNLQWAASPNPAVFSNYAYNVNFGLMQVREATLDITNYDTTDNPAFVGGEPAKLTLKGNIAESGSVIEWRDSKGKVVKSCDISSTDDLKGCETFDIPKDAKAGDIYTAVLVSNGEEIAADSFIIGETSKNLQPEYEDGKGKPGEDVTVPAPTFKDEDGKGEEVKAPEGTKFTPGEGAPDGVKVDENTGEVTVPIPDDAKPGDKITVPVDVTYPDGSTDTVDVIVTVTDKDADLYEPAYEDKLVVPGKETKSTPTFTDKDGKDTKAPEGSKFSIPEDFKAPEGYEVSIDENTGEITVNFPDKSKLNKDTVEEFDVPVTVTYPDGSKDDAKANFKLDTDGDGKPDTEDEDDDNDGIPDDEDSNPKVPNQNTIFEPGYEDGSGKPGEDVKVEKPEFKDKDGNPTEAPDGTTFGPGENAPDGVTIDENTGEITVTIPEDAKPGDKITVPVEVTYPDGSKDNVDVTVTVEEPEAKDKDADTYEPGYEDGSGKPGEDVKVEKPEFKDKDGNPTEAPEGTTFKPGEDAPEGVKVDENTGEITVPIPEDANPGDKITVPVEVTYPDGSKDNVDVTVTVEEPDAPEQPDTKQADELEPKYNDGAGQPGTTAPVDAPTFTNEDGDTVTVPEGTKFTTDKDGVEVAEDGSLKVQIPADAKPGDKITVPVTVTYPDGSTDKVDVTVTVTDPDSKPEWGDGEGEPGDKVTVPNTGGDVPEGSTTEVEGPGKVEIGENGELIVTIDEDAKPGDKIVVEVKDPEGNTIDESTVTVTEPSKPDTKQADEFEPGYEDGSGKPGEDVKVEKPEFKDKDGNPTEAPDGTKFTPGDDAPDGVKVDENTGEITVPVPEDAKPGDKITVPVEVTYPDGSKDNVDVTITVEKPDAPAEKPDWKDDKGKPGDKVEIPNDGGPVPDGTTVETEGPGKAEIDEDGNIVVDIDKDAKPGDKVVVVVKDKDGNEIDRVVVEVEKPADQPDWKDGNGKPGDKIVIPNDGGPVPDGSTVEVEGPGKAEIDKDGNIVVDINDDAKPGDKIVVTVKDKDGNVIDTITVTVDDKGKTGSGKPAPSKPGDSGDKGSSNAPLPRTGVEIAGALAAAAGLLAAGVLMVARSRRKNN
ncbi:C protein alpha-antigen precursor [Brevibacterium ravenspurgense]|uniref:C protein alpha-antigen n=1 Tax=Brevibacterium ravenspurgense TaxID=479117 RepID=A0A150H9W9_9MICO|nr:YPDG domain-containing protein [Brevibacterium ravenspurgense]KXZ58906.1 C protein alpha-antigen precursor [Brevibacterium ravenspurgense]